MNVRDHAGAFGALDERNVIKRRLDVAKAGLREPYALLGELLEIIICHPRFKDNISADDPHAAWTEIVPAAFGGNCERLHRFDVVRRPRHMNLTGGNRSSRTPVKVVLQESHGGQTRCVIAKGDVDMGVDKPRTG